MAQALLWPVFALHIGGGMLALVAGTVAAAAPKGGRLHRRFGGIFFAAMVVMALSAIALAAILPGQLINIFIGIFTLYLTGTAWLAVRRKPGTAGAADWIAALAGIAISAPFVIIAVQLAAGMKLFFTSAIEFKGPVLIALYVFTAILVIAAASDVAVVLRHGIAGRARIARHLWRMCLSLGLAYGSGFTNGLARLLPGPYHVPPAFFLPQLAPVLLLVYWMVRVRMTSWRPVARLA